MTSAVEKARIRWGTDRRQRNRQRLREDCRHVKERFADPKYRATLERAIGVDEVSKIIRANEEMLNDLGKEPHRCPRPCPPSMPC
jgi:hypothetical protein